MAVLSSEHERTNKLSILNHVYNIFYIIHASILSRFYTDWSDFICREMEKNKQKNDKFAEDD